MQLLVISGRVGKDAELRTTQNGEKVLGFSMAVNNGKDASGSERPPTWYDCSIWGKRAESLSQHIRKGDSLTLSGRPTARAHEGKAYLGINVNELTFNGSGNRQQGDTRQQSSQPDSYGGGYATSRDLDDEIPF